MTLKQLLNRLVRDEEGATSVEYGLIAAILGIGLVATLITLKGNLNALFTRVGNTVASQ